MKKIKKYAGCFVALSMLLASFAAEAFAASVISIHTAANLAAFCEVVNSGNSYVNQTVRLESDIDVTDFVNSWEPIGTDSVNKFSGVFDGNNKTISGFGGQITDSEFAGLFGYTDGSIRNLNVSLVSCGITADNVSGRMYAGVIAGYSAGTVENCTVSASGNILSPCGEYFLNSSYVYGGGITGLNTGTVKNCTVSGDLYGDIRADYTHVYADISLGGVCGTNQGTVESCVFQGEIKGKNSYASSACGGIVGDNRGDLVTSKASGNIKAEIRYSPKMAYAYAGGVCGSNTGNVRDCGSDADVNGNITANSDVPCGVDVGGVAGYNVGIVENSVNSGSVSGTMGYPNINLKTDVNVGGVIGYNSGTVEKCGNSGSVINTENYGGGVVGYNYGGKVLGCRASGSIALNVTTVRTIYVGGVAGGNEEGLILSCYTVTEPDLTNNAYFGGICGNNIKGSIEHSCCLNTEISSDNGAGICAVNNGSLRYCYTTAQVTNANASRVLSGDGFLQHCLYQSESGADGSGTVAELKSPSFYENWHMEDFWQFDETDGYPYPKPEPDITFASGDGTQDSPYIIYSEKDLDKIRYTFGKYFYLAADVVMSENWLPIGSVSPQPFSGVLDGNGHSISGLKSAVVNGVSGLFGYTENCNINSLNIIEAETEVTAASDDAYTKNYAGSLVGYGRNVVLKNCRVSGNISLTQSNIAVGGIAGEIFGNISNCISDTDISVNASDGLAINISAGGLVGNMKGTLTWSESTADVNVILDASAPSAEIGGMAGGVSGEISNICALGDIGIRLDIEESDAVVCGGIAGRLDGSLRNVLSKGSFDNAEQISGAAGVAYNGEIENVYYTTDNIQTAQLVSMLNENSNDTSCFWVSDAVKGVPVPVHISVDYLVDGGIWKCSFTANAAADIYYGNAADTAGNLYSVPIPLMNTAPLYYYASDGTYQTEAMHITPHNFEGAALIYDFNLFGYKYDTYDTDVASAASRAYPIRVGALDSANIRSNYLGMKYSAITKSAADTTERRFFIHDADYTGTDDFLTSLGLGSIEHGRIRVATQTNITPNVVENWGFNGFQLANGVVNLAPLTEQNGGGGTTDWHNTMDLSACLENGYAVWRIRIPDSYLNALKTQNPTNPLQDIYLTLAFGTSIQNYEMYSNPPYHFNKENFTGVPLGDYYDASVGGYQTLAVPLSAFDNRDGNFNCYAMVSDIASYEREDLYFTNNAKYFHGMGMIRNDTDADNVTGFAYDATAMSIVKVLPVTDLMADIVSDGVQLTWKPSQTKDVKYRVFRDGEVVAEVDSAEYLDTSVIGNDCLYTVKSVISLPCGDVTSAGAEILVPTAEFYHNSLKIESMVSGDITLKTYAVPGAVNVIAARKKEQYLIEARPLSFMDAVAEATFNDCDEEDTISVYYWDALMNPLRSPFILK